MSNYKIILCFLVISGTYSYCKSYMSFTCVLLPKHLNTLAILCCNQCLVITFLYTICQYFISIIIICNVLVFNPLFLFIFVIGMLHFSSQVIHNVIFIHFQIPFYPVVNKDLTFIHLGNNSKIEGLINFEKLRMIAKEVRSLSNMCSSPYDLLTMLELGGQPASNAMVALNQMTTASSQYQAQGKRYNVAGTSTTTRSAPALVHNQRSRRRNRPLVS